jgi:hypothetical protein
MTSLGDLRNLGYDNIFSKKPIEDTTVEASKWELWIRFPDLTVYDHLWTEKAEHWVDPLFPLVLKNKDKIWKFNKDNYVDLHPTPEIHNLWLNQKLKPKLPDEYNYDYVRESMVENSKKLKSLTDYTLDDFSVVLEKMYNKMFDTLPCKLPQIEKKIGF